MPTLTTWKGQCDMCVSDYIFQRRRAPRVQVGVIAQRARQHAGTGDWKVIAHDGVATGSWKPAIARGATELHGVVSNAVLQRANARGRRRRCGIDSRLPFQISRDKTASPQGWPDRVLPH